jgi:hypothetical protein
MTYSRAAVRLAERPQARRARSISDNIAVPSRPRYMRPNTQCHHKDRKRHRAGCTNIHPDIRPGSTAATRSLRVRKPTDANTGRPPRPWQAPPGCTRPIRPRLPCRLRQGRQTKLPPKRWSERACAFTGPLGYLVVKRVDDFAQYNPPLDGVDYRCGPRRIYHIAACRAFRLCSSSE